MSPPGWDGELLDCAMLTRCTQWSGRVPLGSLFFWGCVAARCLVRATSGHRKEVPNSLVYNSLHAAHPTCSPFRARVDRRVFFRPSQRWTAPSPAQNGSIVAASRKKRFFIERWLIISRPFSSFMKSVREEFRLPESHRPRHHLSIPRLWNFRIRFCPSSLHGLRARIRSWTFL